uniref:Peptidase S1 domain-containing protein n=1 Tax=Anopheles dirus TaxID=7168 RepID=A0A182MXY8_9DIPT
MSFLLPIVLAMVRVAFCEDFFDDPPPDHSVGNGFEDCAKRFTAKFKIPQIEVFGGVRALQGEFQHMAAIGWTRSDGTIDYLCGGSLITLQFVLTAGHCAVDSKNIPPDTVRLGDTDLATDDEDDELAQQVRIVRFIKHPQYRESKRYYDIALIELEQGVKGNDAICAACVWRERTAPNAGMEAVGFGATGFGERLSPTLQKVQLRELNKAQCAMRVPTSRRQLPEGLRDDQLCAHSETMDTCEGDSGGPIQTVLNDVFGNMFPFVVGVVSFGTPCTQGSTGVYTRISSYLDWIAKETNQPLNNTVCTDVQVCERKANHAISAEIRPRWPKSRFGLLWAEAETDVYQCGGLLIDFQYVLTSARCVTSAKGPPAFVAADPSSDRVPVEDVFVHPQYDRDMSAFDIALLKLSKYANLNETLPICPWMEQPETARSDLKFRLGASIPYTPLRVRDADNGSRSFILQSQQGQECPAGEHSAAKDLVCISRNVSLVPGTCQVDYGGPVLIEVAKNVHRVYGVQSRLTDGCGSNAIFTSIKHHTQWLETIMFSNLNDRLPARNMIVLVAIVLLIAGVAQCQDFVDYPPANYTVGSSFDDCGRRFPPKKIDYAYIQSVGGERAYQGEFQHMTAIGWTRSEERIDYLCGGSLITWKFVLTAAHCAVDSNLIAPDTVRLGDTDLGSADDDGQAHQEAIARIIKHPRYREPRKYYDLALIELAKRVYSNGAICIACVWREPNSPAAVMDAVGFGALGFGEQLSPTLQKVRLSALDTAECAKRVPTSRRQMPEGLREDQLCAHSETMDTCEGDSGGPIETKLHDVFGNVFPLVVGVVSFGTPCTQGSTGVYTRVSSFLDWMEQETNQSLSYNVCTGVNVCNRAVNPSITATVNSNWPANRVGLLWQKEDTDLYQCGGFLVDYQYVVTSADCVTSSKGPPRYVTVTADSTRVPIDDVFVHPRFAKGQPYFDIALIKLRMYANLAETQPVCPWTDRQHGDWRAASLRYGATIIQKHIYVEYFNETLKTYLSLTVRGAQCSAGGNAADNDLLCISRNASLVPASCKLDYGGPVLTEVADNLYLAHGVLSRQTRDCGGNVIFTSIKPHTEWLQSIMFKKLHERLVFNCPKRFYSDVGPFEGGYGGIGGVRVYRGEFQHMVAVGWTRDGGKVDYLCGGSLISQKFVLTAAHCAWDGNNLRPDTVRLGDTDLGSTEDDEYAQQIAIARLIVHPQYRGSRKYFDVALIELRETANFTNAVCHACLWQEKALPDGPMDAVGFGATGFGEALSPTLQRVVLNHVARDECVKRISVNRREMPQGFREDQFCAAGGTMDTCEGDSGGPIGVKLLDVGGAVTPLVTGVVSFGTPCIEGSTGVYTKISEYIDWIERETNASHSYEVCTKTMSCVGRPVENINIYFQGIYTKNRFGLLWNRNDMKHECGATLIDYQFLLTTASCVTSERGHPKFVTSMKDEQATVADVYISPLYKPGRPENDIALVKITQYVNYKVYRPACLWDKTSDGEWTFQPKFSAYGPRENVFQPLTFSREMITVTAQNGTGCEEEIVRGTDLRCYNNKVAMMPGVCAMDYGAPVFDKSFWGDPVFVYGVVSPMSKSCGTNLFVIDVTPHIAWIESIIIWKRDQYLKRFYSDVGDYNGPYGGYGGVRVLRGEFQHMVAIGWTRDGGRIDYLCGGSLISSTYVLTAAHCYTDGDNIQPDTVRTGDTDLGSTEDDEFAQQIAIARIVRHPQHRASRKYFDVALIELQNEAEFTSAVCPACLWQEKQLPDGSMDAIGFGATGFGEALSPTLQRVVLNHVAQSECRKRITVSRREMPEGFRTDQFCAAGNNMDTCEGDSGGPIGVKLLDVGGAVTPLVTGVVSFGTPCVEGSTGVYTKISEYIGWIERETNASHSYAVCTKTPYCIGRPRVYVPARFENIYTNSRFGLLWNRNDNEYDCGATLIDYQFLLTTASCVTSKKGHPKFVTSLSKEQATITDVFVSPQYTPGRPEYDIALIKIDKYVNYTVYRPACLWDRKTNGEWSLDPVFSAYGPVEESYQSLTFRNSTITVTAPISSVGCEEEKVRGTDLRCYNNSVAMMPGVCAMDHGAGVIDQSLYGEPVHLYGVVSPLSKSCGTNLFVIDVTPHIAWLEAIIVAIGWTRDGGQIDYLCGGSLISKTFVLTAAHCYADRSNISPDTVRIGDTDLGSAADDEFAQQIPIARIITHPQYRASRKYFDVALIELQKEVKFTSAVCPACLWQEKQLPDGSMDAIGFGATGFGEALSPTLQRVVLNQVARDECVKRVTVSRREMPEGFRADQFCAAGGTMDTCEGDSGGPIGVKLLNVGGAVIPLVVGVVSFGTPCIEGSTGVYTKTSEYIDWIERETNTSHSYQACIKTTSCIGRPRLNVPVNFAGIYTRSRFDLLWNANDLKFECGATLIDYQFLLTTASCVTSTKGHPKFASSVRSELADIVDVYVSPSYKPGRPEHDIALVKIAQYVNYTVYRPACLWNRNTDGEWSSGPSFSAYGPGYASNETIGITAEKGFGCEEEQFRGTDVRCYNNRVALMPGVCSMDYGAPVTDNPFWGDPVFVYGVVSPLSKSCGTNLFMIDVTPHIAWIESIIVAKRDQYLLFSD